MFGTGTVLVPWGALCLLTGNVPKGLGLLALYGVISLVRSVLEPKIMAAQVDLPPLAALAAMYVGFCAFGAVGLYVLVSLVAWLGWCCVPWRCCLSSSSMTAGGCGYGNSAFHWGKGVI